MKETYIFLDVKDKKSLMALAQQHQLSLSTTAAIIIKWYFLPINALYKDYIHKGTQQVHIKIRNELQHDINCMNVTNCLYCYFNHPQNEVKINWRKLNQQIKKELETTIDRNANKNIEMRIAWRLQRGRV